MEVRLTTTASDRTSYTIDGNAAWLEGGALALASRPPSGRPPPSDWTPPSSTPDPQVGAVADMCRERRSEVGYTPGIRAAAVARKRRLPMKEHFNRALRVPAFIMPTRPLGDNRVSREDWSRSCIL
jgi:hypothetical protein